MIAALFVETDGCYFGLKDVEPWDEKANALYYQDDYPVIAHPPCQRWGRFWHGSTRKPHQFELGDDGGCFRSALTSVWRCGGLLEHPADSRAFSHFGLPIPKRGAGWTKEDQYGGRSCYVEQGHYGHPSRKPTWLYAVDIVFAELIWDRGEQVLPQWMIDRYGYEKARRIGVVAMIGGKDKTKKRNATPEGFRDLLLLLAETVRA